MYYQVCKCKTRAGDEVFFQGLWRTVDQDFSGRKFLVLREEMPYRVVLIRDLPRKVAVRRLKKEAQICIQMVPM